MRWPWVRRWPEARRAIPAPAVTAAELGSRCEECGEHAIIFLNGQHILCWMHYVAEMRKVREGA